MLTEAEFDAALSDDAVVAWVLSQACDEWCVTHNERVYPCPSPHDSCRYGYVPSAGVAARLAEADG